MSGAAAAADRLRAALRGVEYSVAAATPQPLGGEADLVELMQVVARAVLALADLKDAAEAGEAVLRAALAEEMAGSGCYSIRTGTHAVSLGLTAPVVQIVNAALIPDACLRHPAPVPDKLLIAKILRSGRHIPGAQLGDPRPCLRFVATGSAAA